MHWIRSWLTFIRISTRARRIEVGADRDNGAVADMDVAVRQISDHWSMVMTKASRIRTSFAAGKFVVGTWACAMPPSTPAAPAAAAVFISVRRVMVMRSFTVCSPALRTRSIQNCKRTHTPQQTAFSMKIRMCLARELDVTLLNWGQP
jgi:hypothetical protein